MLVLIELLQRAKIPTYTQFNRIKYLQLRVIFTQFTEKSNIENGIKNHSNMMIKVAKSFDKKITNIESLEG